MIALLLASAVLLLPSDVLANSGQDLPKLIWKGRMEWRNSTFTGLYLNNNALFSRGSPVQQTENVFEAGETNEEIPAVRFGGVKYEFMELDIIKLINQPRYAAALQLLFTGVSTPNIVEYLSIVVPVSGVLATDEVKSLNPKLEISLHNLGRKSVPNNVYIDSLAWLESILNKKFISMEDSALLHPAVQIYDHLYLSNVEYVQDAALAPFFLPSTAVN